MRSSSQMPSAGTVEPDAGRISEAAQADPERVGEGASLAYLWAGGVFLVVGCLAYLALFQSRSLWDSAVPLPGGEEWPFGAMRRIFPVGWVQASRGSPLGLLNVGIYLLMSPSYFTIVLVPCFQ